MSAYQPTPAERRFWARVESPVHGIPGFCAEAVIAHLGDRYSLHMDKAEFSRCRAGNKRTPMEMVAAVADLYTRPDLLNAWLAPVGLQVVPLDPEGEEIRDVVEATRMSGLNEARIAIATEEAVRDGVLDAEEREQLRGLHTEARDRHEAILVALLEPMPRIRRIGAGR